MARFLLLLVLLGVGFAPRLPAQQPRPKAVVLPADTAVRSARQPEATRWKELRAERAFQYGKDVTPPSSFLDQLWRQIREWLLNWLYGSENQTTRNWLTAVFVVVLLAFAAYKFRQMDKRDLFAGRGTPLNVPYAVASENIHAIQFEEEIAAAVEKQNYRLAVRLYYLKILKELADRNLIRWQRDKTNRMYVHELEKTDLEAGFEQITLKFEFVWYGHFSVNEPQFAALRAEFDAFRRTLPAP